ncbi:hypothetical protein ACX818_001368 [Acinetobacter baumannii]
MKKIFMPTAVVLNVHTAQMPQGEYFDIFVPSWTKTIAVDSDGKVHAFKCSSHLVVESSDQWDTCFEWELVADLEFNCQNWRNLKFEVEFSDESRVGGVFEVREGV